MLRCAGLEVMYGLQHMLLEDLPMQLSYAVWQLGHAPSLWRVNTMKGMPVTSHGAQADEDKDESSDLADDHKLPYSTTAYFDFPNTPAFRMSPCII